MDFDQLSLLSVLSAPLQVRHCFVGRLAATVIDLPVALDRAVKHLVRTVQVHHQVLGGVPGVHQHHPKWQLLHMQRLIEHLLHVRELGLRVGVWRVHPPVNDPVALGLGIHIQAVDHTNAFDQAMCVTAVLQLYQLNLVRMILVGNAVIKDKKSIDVVFNDILYLFPNILRCHVIVIQVAIDRIMRKALMVIRKVGLRVIRLSGEQKLTVVAPCWLHNSCALMK